MIISASRRTDIPAFYSEWLFNRLREEYVLVRNPMNIHQVGKVSLSEASVIAWMFPHIHSRYTPCRSLPFVYLRGYFSLKCNSQRLHTYQSNNPLGLAYQTKRYFFLLETQEPSLGDIRDIAHQKQAIRKRRHPKAGRSPRTCRAARTGPYVLWKTCMNGLGRYLSMYGWKLCCYPCLPDGSPIGSCVAPCSPVS